MMARRRPGGAHVAGYVNRSLVLWLLVALCTSLLTAC
jgi:hypothetical protein